MIHEQTYIFSSDPNLGAEKRSSDGSAFSVRFEQGFGLDAHAVDKSSIYMQVDSATVWNSSPNVITGVNDTLYFAYGGTSATLVFPEGVYSIADSDDTLNEELQTLLVGAGLPSDLFKFTVVPHLNRIAVESTDTVYGTKFLGFDQSNSIGKLLGFNSVVALTPGPISVRAPNRASFNNVNYFLIQTDLISDGIPVNDRSQGIIAEVPILVQPNSQIAYEPYNPPKVHAPTLSGMSKYEVRFSLLNDNADPVIMPEYWTFRMRLFYQYLPVSKANHRS
jgi:hypothetical protein